MGSDDNQNSERELREKIASLMQSISQSPIQQIPTDQLAKLKTAATRLDHLLKSNADQDQQSLKTAVEKLDQLLSNIRKGKDVSESLKSRRQRNSGE